MPPGASPKIQIPRWIQLVGLPVLLLLIWVVAGRVFHVVFLFLVASLIALLFDPLVRWLSSVQLGRFRIRRGFSVAFVYLVFAAALIAVIWGLATVIVDQTKTAANRFDTYFTVVHGQPPRTDADRDVDRLQHWLDDHGLASIKVQERGHRWVKQIREKDVTKYTGKVVDFVEGAAISVGKFLFAAVVVLVASIYMLLDFDRLARGIDRRFPPHPNSEPLLVRMEQAVAGYVKGQFLISLIIGASAGVGMWILGALGLVPGADKYALLFGAWVGLTELIPYLGPWLGAIPAAIYAIVVDPISILWVAGLFLIIHQVEGHIVVPNVMGSALRLHPLLVIFGLLAGGEIYGLAGILVALPLLAAARAAYEFFGERVQLEPWGTAGPIDVEVEVEPQPPPVAPVPEPEAETEVREAAAPHPPVRQLTSLLAARGVGRRFGDHVALEPTDVEVRGGEVLALVGPNGAGKSTLLGILAGALPPSEGKVELGPNVRAGWMPQRPAHYGRLSARQNLELFARLQGVAGADALLARLELPADERPASTLSVGNRQRLDLAISLLGDPQVLLLDEPTAALDPRQRRRLWETARGVRDAGGAVVLVTQNVEDLEHVADRVVMLLDGRVVFDGPVADYRRSEEAGALR